MTGFTHLKLVVAGHVDHGKSTLIGQLMHVMGALSEERLQAVAASCAARGIAFEWAFVMDALRQERAQGITLDSSHIVLKTADAEITLIDAPGHHELLKNLMTGASEADAALLVVDAAEGISEQTRRHASLLGLLGVDRVVLVVNKMDKVEFSKARFKEIVTGITSCTQAAGLSLVAAIPVAARDGDMLAARSPRMPWYDGAVLIEAIRAITPRAAPQALPLRALVQDVYRREDQRLIAVRVESGVLREGDTVVLMPSGSQARLVRFESWPEAGAVSSAAAGEAAVLQLDQPVLAERGMVLCHPNALPHLGSRFRARIFWLAPSPLMVGSVITTQVGTASCEAEITEIQHRYDPQDFSLQPGGGQVAYGEIAEVTIRARRPLLLADAPDALSRMVIVHGGMIAGGGIISTAGYTSLQALRLPPKSTHLQHSQQPISQAEHEAKNGHRGLVVWLTGLSCSGKSTLASGAARRLFDKGYQVTTLDGDQLRAGLCRDLGFDEGERRENIRRAAEVAALMAQSGLITLASFISPLAQDRDLARSCAPSMFHLVHVSASVATCEKRDSRGLYARARRGEINQFTGISAPYEAPQDAELVIDTEALSAQNAIDMLCDYIEKHACLP